MLAPAGEGGIEAGVIAHGSRVTVEDVQAIKKPVLFLFSDNDKMIPTELREQFEGILREKSHSFAAEGKFYPGMVNPLPRFHSMLAKLHQQLHFEQWLAHLT